MSLLVSFTMRILSIDYGKKRTGIAVTDSLQIIANGLATVATSALFDFLKTYVAQEEVERIVMGKPMQTNGKPSENFARVQQFVNRWRKAMPQIPIEFYDERFTSVLAHQAIFAKWYWKESPSKQSFGRRNFGYYYFAELYGIET